MDSREFGLVATQQLFQVENLHYGFWEKGAIPSIETYWAAQQAHTAFLFQHIENAMRSDKNGRILDSGCGVGTTTRKLLEMGYRVDGLVPSRFMAEQARKNTERYKDATRGEIYEYLFESFPITSLREKYRLVFFSESFQYVNMQKAVHILDRILSETGTVIIFDFFKKDAVIGTSPMGGGHSIGEFYALVKKKGYVIDTDLDVTEHLSPNLRLINDLLVQRIIPFSKTLDAFLLTRYPFFYKLLKYLFRKKLEKLTYKYSETRNEEAFQKFKTYRLIVLKKS